MSNIPNLNEMLKLHTKKELWERIQHHIKTIDTLRQQLEEKDNEISKLQASYQQLETDRDIWIKAYEIALKESGTWWKYDGESNANAMELYYKKAQKLIKNENKN